MSIKEYYDKQRLGISAEDMTARVMRAAQEQPKHRAVRKPAVVAAAAAVVVMAGGVTAAATGMFNINDIFGGRINAQDEQLAGELVIAAEDFSWSVSDDDYMIEFKGITGSISDMMLVYELKRTDGKPVIDYMTNIPEDGRLIGLVDYNFPDETAFTTFLNTDQYIINEQGNVEVCNQIITDGDLSTYHYSVDTINLYPEEILYSYMRENDIFMKSERYKDYDNSVGFYNNDHDTPTAIALNDERVIGLELTWNVDFTYSPSDIAAFSKSISNEDAVLEVSRWTTYEKTEKETFNCNVIKSQFSCVGGWIEVKYQGASSGVLYNELNEVYLLTADDSKVPCVFEGIGHSMCLVDNAETTLRTVIRYSDTIDSPITAIDISEIVAISINGETFPLA